jgi:hypothetical protein
LKTGSLANFIIASGEIFNDKTILYETGFKAKFVINDIAIRDIRGDYDLTINSENTSGKLMAMLLHQNQSNNYRQ